MLKSLWLPFYSHKCRAHWSTSNGFIYSPMWGEVPKDRGPDGYRLGGRGREYGWPAAEQLYNLAWKEVPAVTCLRVQSIGLLMGFSLSLGTINTSGTFPTSGYGRKFQTLKGSEHEKWACRGEL